MGAAFENFPLKRGDCAARAAHPDPQKHGPDKVLDEKGSDKIALDGNLIREGKTSRGNVNVSRDVTKRSSSGKSERIHPVRGYSYDMQSHTEASVLRYLEFQESMKARCTQWQHHAWMIIC